MRRAMSSVLAAVTKRSRVRTSIEARSQPSTSRHAASTSDWWIEPASAPAQINADTWRKALLVVGSTGTSLVMALPALRAPCSALCWTVSGRPSSSHLPRGTGRQTTTSLRVVATNDGGLDKPWTRDLTSTATRQIVACCKQVSDKGEGSEVTVSKDEANEVFLGLLRVQKLLVAAKHSAPRLE